MARRLQVEALEERRMLATFTVTNLLDGPVAAAGQVPGSLRQAIFDANAAAGADEIEFSGVSGTITLNSGELRITSVLTIDGPGAELLTIDASGNDPTPEVNNGDGSRIFNVADGNANNHLIVQISGLTLTGGDAGGLTYESNLGGAIYSTESLTLSHSTLIRNAAVFSGGGLFALSLNGANTVVVDSLIQENEAKNGGGITLEGNGQLTRLTRVLVSGNLANDYNGGGLSLMQGNANFPVVVTDSVISNNTAEGIGGGIAGRYLTIQNSRITGNVSVGPGGGIHLGESATLQGNYIADNISHDTGGGVHIEFGNNHVPKLIKDNTIARNHAVNRGGGINTRSRTTINGNTFSENSTDRSGGGLFITSDSSNSVVINNEFTANSAVMDGGGIYLSQNNDQNEIEDNQFTDNQAGLNGGGMSVEVESGSITIALNTFEANEATLNGGGLYATTKHDDVDGELILDENHFLSNIGAGGGGLAINTDAVRFYGLISKNSIHENTAGGGGGIILSVTEGDIDFTDNSIYQNIALGSFSDGGGMQLRNGGGTIRVANSTISSNDAGSTGGGISAFTQGGTTTIKHSTIAFNNTSSGVGGGGGVFHVGAALSIDHTIITNNSAGNANANLYDLSGTAVATYSLLTGSAMLSPLVDNGGPTLTHGLLFNSPAIDAGDSLAVAGLNGVPLYDQRGVSYDRIHGSRIDIGAFERQSLTLLVDTEIDENDGDLSEGDLSLREAVGIANSNAGAIVTIQFSSILAGKTILLNQGEMLLSNPVTIVGLGANQLTIDASGNDPTPDVNNRDGSRIFRIDVTGSGSPEFLISGLTLTGGDANGNGGAIDTREKLTLSDCVLTANHGGLGGAIFSIATLTMAGSSLTNNSAASQGGAVGGIGGLSISNSILENNMAPNGGAISFQTGNLTIVDSLIQDNIASTGSGGGVLLFIGSVAITSSTISGNSAATNGGGISANSLTISSSLITGNTARDGGGIYATTLTTTNTTISGNFAQRYGGGIAASGPATFNHTTITNNTADADANNVGRGGGVWKTNGSTSFNHTILANNLDLSNQAADIDTTSAAAASFVANYSLIEDTTGLAAAHIAAITAGAGNLTNVDPLLGSLQDNGGPTHTQAILAGSPALDAGNPSFVSPPEYDQRGTGFGRVENGLIDIGAFEVQAETLPGDFDSDNDVDGRDFLLWQRNPSLGTLLEWQEQYLDPPLLGDFDIDSDVDGRDFLLWQRNPSLGSLATWQEQYGGGELLAVSSQLLASQESSDESREPDSSMAPWAVSLLSTSRDRVPCYECETASDDEAAFEDSYVEQVDRALEELAVVPGSGVRGFGEMVARRGVKGLRNAEFGVRN